MRYFDAQLVATIPSMAWIYLIRQKGRPQLFHGRSVEVQPDGFFEGCYAGHWLMDEIVDCAEVFGSGLKLKDGVHYFVTPSHTLEALFTLDRGKELAISNSLCFLLEYFDITLPFDLKYSGKFSTAVQGIDAYERNIASTLKGSIRRVIYDNMTVSSNLEVDYRRKGLPPPFPDYTSYVSYLTDILKLAFSNASDGGRSIQYSPLATCSAGYDSAASAAIASRLGCRTAVSLKTARGGTVDSGRATGEALGLEVLELDRAADVESFEDVAEFFAMGMGGEDYCYRYFSSILNSRILLTGFHGDKVWEIHASPNANLARGDLSGSSLQEFRLNQNFIHIPVPMIGCRRHQELFEISEHQEMIPYRLNRGHYDRPIPRRILEERGVDRELFGQEKKAASVLFFIPRWTGWHGAALPSLSRYAGKKYFSLSLLTRAKILTFSLLWQVRLFFWILLKNHRIFPSQIRRIMPNIIVRNWQVFEHQDPYTVVQFLSGLEFIKCNRYRNKLKNENELSGRYQSY